MSDIRLLIMTIVFLSSLVLVPEAWKEKLGGSMSPRIGEAKGTVVNGEFVE